MPISSLNYTVFNGTSIQDMFLYGNSVTGDLWGVMIVFGVFMVCFVSLKSGYSMDRSMVTASFITLMLTIALNIASIVSSQIVLEVVVVGIISIFVFIYSQKSSG